MILASDVFESGASVDRLLFGTLLGLDGSDLALSGRLRGGRPRGHARARPGLGRDRVRPRRGPRARPAHQAGGPRAARARGARGRGGDPRGGRPARGRRVHPSGRGRAPARAQRPRASVLGGGAGARRGRGRALPRLLARRSARARRSRCSERPSTGCWRSARPPRAGGRRRWPHERAARPGRRARRRLRGPARAHRRELRRRGGRVGLRARAQRRRQDDPLPRAARRARARSAGRCRWRSGPPTWRRPSARASTSRSARSTWR